MPSDLHEPILRWYADHARDLPWREPSASPWAVMVSEFMLQQTPVSRVLPVYDAWLARWPTPSSLAAESAGEAVRMWGRLGYPRRALRLHAAATAIRDDHDGQVPAAEDTLRTLPGIGDYTAAAVAAFAFRQRHAVLDTNVRRVLGRLVDGVEHPSPNVRVAERRAAEALLPDDPDTAATWSVAVMELGALVCTANNPRCGACPVEQHCRWVALGKPAYAGPPRRAQAWAGTDRQCRGRVMALVRDAPGSVARRRFDAVWSEPEQLERALDGLVGDGLLVRTQQEGAADIRYALP